jgi:hypothetical protein
MVYGGVQWDFGMFPLGRPPNKNFRHIVEFGSPMIDEGMGELHGEEYSSEIDLRLGYPQNRDKEQDTRKIALRCYLESLVIPLGLTKAPDTFQSCKQWHLVLFSDANSIFSRTWKVRMRQLGEAGRIIAMSEFFHLGYVVRAQEEIHIVLDQFTEISADRVVDGIIHYRGCAHVVLESTLRERIMRARYDSLLTGHEAPQVPGLLSREVFRLHELLEYIDDDRDSGLPGAVWQKLNILAGT